MDKKGLSLMFHSRNPRYRNPVRSGRGGDKRSFPHYRAARSALLSRPSDRTPRRGGCDTPEHVLVRHERRSL